MKFLPDGLGLSASSQPCSLGDPGPREARPSLLPPVALGAGSSSRELSCLPPRLPLAMGHALLLVFLSVCPLAQAGSSLHARSVTEDPPTHHPTGGTRAFRVRTRKAAPPQALSVAHKTVPRASGQGRRADTAPAHPPRLPSRKRHRPAASSGWDGPIRQASACSPPASWPQTPGPGLPPPPWSVLTLWERFPGTGRSLPLWSLLPSRSAKWAGGSHPEFAGTQRIRVVQPQVLLALAQPFPASRRWPRCPDAVRSSPHEPGRAPGSPWAPLF